MVKKEQGWGGSFFLKQGKEWGRPIFSVESIWTKHATSPLLNKGASLVDFKFMVENRFLDIDNGTSTKVPEMFQFLEALFFFAKALYIPLSPQNNWINRLYSFSDHTTASEFRIIPVPEISISRVLDRCST